MLGSEGRISLGFLFTRCGLRPFQRPRRDGGSRPSDEDKEWNPDGTGQHPLLQGSRIGSPPNSPQGELAKLRGTARWPVEPLCKRPLPEIHVEGGLPRPSGRSTPRRMRVKWDAALTQLGSGVRSRPGKRARGTVELDHAAAGTFRHCRHWRLANYGRYSIAPNTVHRRTPLPHPIHVTLRNPACPSDE